MTAATNPHGVVLFGGSAADAADKEFADVDPDSGRVILSWTNFTSTVFAPSGVEISSAYSDNVLGATLSTWSPRTIVSAVAVDGQAPVPRFAAGSDEVYIAWQRSITGLTNNVRFAKSTDNGATFAPAVNVAPTAHVTMDQVPGKRSRAQFPVARGRQLRRTVPRKHLPQYANNDSRDGADVMMQRSLDQGSRSPGRSR